jgi:hypothetical protein
MDLLRSYVMTSKTLEDDQVYTIPSSTTSCGRVIDAVEVTTSESCEEYDTTFGPLGKEGQVTEFSW